FNIPSSPAATGTSSAEGINVHRAQNSPLHLQRRAGPAMTPDIKILESSSSASEKIGAFLTQLSRNKG
ncbi:MAG: hypothetical protein PHX89_03560, partial [bacterium]|nr:hypothetical protein [bacterium]